MMSALGFGERLVYARVVSGQPEVRRVSVGGRFVCQRELGSGRPLVLLHGLAGSWRWWSPLFPALTASRRLYVPELPAPAAGPGRRRHGIMGLAVA